MERREFYTVEDLKDFLDFEDENDKLSNYCSENECSMIIPLNSSIGQSIPTFFIDTEKDMPGVILCEGVKLFSDTEEIIEHWVNERGQSSLPKLHPENKQSRMELIVRYLISFGNLCKKRKAFPIDIEKTYEIEELWMKEGYISIIQVKHFQKGFTEKDKQALLDIDKSMFIYISDAVQQSFV